MNKPQFTREQQDWICGQIGEWYLEWKDKIVDCQGACHNLGIAKEHLKSILTTDISLDQLMVQLMIGQTDDDI